MNWWNQQVVPRVVDASLKGPEVGLLRRDVCAGLHGRVLEIGFGGGLNIRWWPDAVTSVSAVEPADEGWRLSARRRQRTTVPIVREGLDGQDLALADASHDSALITFTLCSIPDPARALREVYRVLVPGATVHFLEHGLSPHPGVARWQRRIDPVQSRLCGGCHLSYDITALLTDAGFEVEELTSEPMPGLKGPAPWVYSHRGVARRP